ncbi:MAG: MarR family transcriptional regulator [Burkholderiales bacterium]|uniref:MarR family winged helix-turn-helix transcriptional regulator n=1 Tax=Ottowia pentelensis TaxID=511108 RepID=A0ABV6PQK7_9BURK|nr:MarR family transcriptional regulator [Ottowia sp.]MBN9406045.1 MarR family transcriptional regulator [Burkholderiales bacterium]MBS0404271.1 MarR family transcriptional regulator [Pseudomonadota bacterium]MBS0413792.1 MarR family transcriptional regulator [Pseudomonadota bacterium]HMN56386.1 MarR family transcriptional regulator [Ottowia sp.]
MRPSPDELEEYPGYFIRRLQQIAVAAFMSETQAWGITPVQFGALSAVAAHPDIDQRTLAGMIRFDTSTIGSVLDRLEKRGLLARGSSATDRRVRLLRLTDDGHALLADVQPAVRRAQERMLAPLPEAERAPFMRMLAVLTDRGGGDEDSRSEPT